MLKTLIAGILVVAVLAGAVILLLSALRPDPVEVDVWTAKPMAIDETVTGVSTGFVEPVRRVGLRAEISGRILEVRAKRGERVAAGQILVVLDDSDINDQLRALDAALPLFEARVAEARARASQVRSDFDRVKRLSESGAVTVQQFETARMALELATAEQGAAESALKQAAVNREIASASKRKTRVAAPFAGIVLECDLVPGQIWGAISPAALAGGSLAAVQGRAEAAGVGSEATALLSPGAAAIPSEGRLELVDDTRMFVAIDVDENEYGKLKTGQAATLVFEALAGTKRDGTVVEIYPFISRALDQNRTARVKIELERAAGIVPGMSANAEILVSSRPAAVAAPTTAVLIRPRGKFVYLVAGGRIREAAVETGLSNWEWTEVTSGLSAGDRIAYPPEGVRLADGLRVAESGRGR